MTSKNQDLHGNAPDKAGVALLLIDVINDLEFPEGEQLFDRALLMARRLVELKRRAKLARIPVVYVNDSFGRWQSNFTSQVEHCLQDGVRGKRIVDLLIPEEDDYFGFIRRKRALHASDAPKGPQQISSGQRPGKTHSNRPQALKGRYYFQDQLRAPHEASTSWDRV